VTLSWGYLFLGREEKMAKQSHHKGAVAVVGLGYVGLALTKSLSKAGFQVSGIDIAREKIKALEAGTSPISDISDHEVRDMLDLGFRPSLSFEAVADAATVIIAVPTPVDSEHRPDLAALEGAVASAAHYLRDGQLWVVESTVLPGVTEELVQPWISSHMPHSENSFFLAYSPERVDPGGSIKDITTIPKIVAGIDEQSLHQAVDFYSSAGFNVVASSSLRAAEAAKLLENTYRAVNMALVNDLAQQFGKAGIDFMEIVRLAATKPFGFHPFWPGPGVGGHCIPVDPWYLEAFFNKNGQGSIMTTVALEVNNQMPARTAERIFSICSREKGFTAGKRSITLLGMTYKPGVNDFRESPGPVVARELEKLGVSVRYHDPFLVSELASLESGEWLRELPGDLTTISPVVILQNHSEYHHLARGDRGGGQILSAAAGSLQIGKSIWDPNFWNQEQ
jgi:nucleotide sugar dehydrogenase